MRMIIALVACILVTTPSIAQKKLKYDIIKESGDTLFHTSEDRLYVQAGTRSVGEELKSTIYKSNGTMRISFYIQTGRTSIFSIQGGASAEIKLQDGSTVTLYSRGDHDSRTTKRDYGCFLYAYYGLDRKAIQQLKSTPVNSIRIRSSAGNMNYEIKDKFSDVIADQLGKF
ncbi:MAG: hypothetical protein ABIR18_15135 [Chitinophagaceae bacterium]